MPKTATDKRTPNIGVKQKFEAFCDFSCDIIVDPLLLAFVIFMVFTRIQTVIDVTTEIPKYPLWVVLKFDIQTHLSIYISFVVVYGLWAVLKRIRYRREMSEKKQLNHTLEKINTNIANLQQAIEDLPDRIAESTKSSKDRDNESR
jgi:hypothetical protein